MHIVFLQIHEKNTNQEPLYTAPNVFEVNILLSWSYTQKDIFAISKLNCFDLNSEMDRKYHVYYAQLL